MPQHIPSRLSRLVSQLSRRHKTNMNVDQLRHYQSKLAFEMDGSDLFAALEAGREARQRKEMK